MQRLRRDREMAFAIGRVKIRTLPIARCVALMATVANIRKAPLAWELAEINPMAAKTSK